MKVLLQDRDTQLFYTDDESSWTADPAHARAFGSSIGALERSIARRLRNINLVLFREGVAHAQLPIDLALA